MIFLSFNRHSRAGLHNHHSELWSDKAGYYMYLPATFKYSYNPEEFPVGIDTLTGTGFTLDYENGLVVDKYTCGIAILQIPFYLAADVLAEPLGYESDGFSTIYHKSINIAAACYLLLGLIFLIKFLMFKFSLRTSIITAFTIFSATGVYYYAVDETGMTHLYSFTLIAVFLYLLRRTKFFSKASIWQMLLAGSIAGLIVVIRPTNILFFACFLFLDLESKEELLERIKVFFRKSIPFIIAAFVFVLPQMLYWNHTYNEPIHYSYVNEGFDFANPELIKFWFSPRSGVFTYTPLFIVILISAVLMIRKRLSNGIFIVGLFVFLCFVFSSWWDWGYGCSFGSRNLVDYLAVFSIPLAYFIQQMSKSKTTIILGVSLFVVLTTMNLKIFYSFDDCFYGEDWEWSLYLNYIFGHT